MVLEIGKLPDDSVNIPKTSLLLELLKLCVGFFIVVSIFFFILGFIADFAVSYISPKMEVKLTSSLGDSIHKKLNENPGVSEDELQRLQKLLDDVVSNLPDNKYPKGWFKLSVNKASMENAFATFGGNIILTTGLLDASQTENEVAMILGHEAAHIVNKDTLRGLGRAFVLLLAYSVVPSDVIENNLFNFSLNANFSKHSKSQEYSADDLGIKLVVARYGHGAGASRFFERAAASEEGLLAQYQQFNSSHPGSLSRIKRIKNYLKENNIIDGKLAPLEK